MFLNRSLPPSLALDVNDVRLNDRIRDHVRLVKTLQRNLGPPETFGQVSTNRD